MSIAELQSQARNLSSEERRKLAAFLVSLRHQESEGYRENLARKIDDKNPDNWVTLEEFEQRLGS